MARGWLGGRVWNVIRVVVTRPQGPGVVSCRVLPPVSCRLVVLVLVPEKVTFFVLVLPGRRACTFQAVAVAVGVGVTVTLEGKQRSEFSQS